MVNYIFGAILIVNSVLGVYWGGCSLAEKRRRTTIKLLVALMGLGSAIWSSGFGVLYLTKNVDTAYYARCFGLLGIFIFLISIQLLINAITAVPKVWELFFFLLSLSGIPIYFILIDRSQMVFFLDRWGMTYIFRDGLPHVLYTVYAPMMAVTLFISILYMIRHKGTRRHRTLGKRFILTELLVIFGAVLDVIFPLMKLPTVPGSAIFQFCAFAMCLHAVSGMEKTYITIPNMSEFVYYSLSVPIVVYDYSGKAKIVNDATCDFLGQKREDLLKSGASIEQLFVLEEENVLDFEGQKKSFHSVCRYNDAQCQVSIDKITDSYEDNIGFIIIIDDVTKQVNTVKRLEEARFEAESANRAKSVFLANMSHEIRTPMNAIVGFSDLLLTRDLPEEEMGFARDIRDSAQNLLGIINDILDISKIESDKMELVLGEYKVAQMFHEICFMMEPFASRKQLQFLAELDDELPSTLIGDATRLREILINLINNAVKYTEKGQVIFRIKLVSVVGSQAWIRYEVDDTGIGIPEEEQGRIFEIFTQVNRNVHKGIEGSGLGLAIVYNLVKMMGGKISVKSEVGAGSKFIVDVPQRVVDHITIGEDSYRHDTPPVSTIGNLKFRNTTVLAVDDSPVNLRVAVNLLNCYGITAETAESGEEAIRMCREKEYPLVFMDQMMPGMDGVEAMKHIRQLSPFYALDGECEIIALTANAVSGAEEELVGAGFDAYISKPIQIDKLEDTLLRFLPKGLQYYEAVEAAPQENVPDLVLPGVDLEKGLLQCGGNWDAYVQVLKLFLSNAPKMLRSMDRELEQGDLANYTIHIHGTKSLCYSIGESQCGDLAKELEGAGKREDEDFIRKHMPDFVTRFTELLNQVTEALIAHGDIERAETEDPREDFEGLLEKMGEAVDQFDFASGSALLAEMREMSLDERQQELCQQMEALLSDLDTDGLQALLEQFAKSGEH